MSIADDLKAATKSVTKKWTRQRKAEERNSRARCNREYVYSDRVNFTDAAYRILPKAYDHASGDGKYTVSKRQIYYASREEFKEATGREIDASYFSQDLLVKFMNRNPSRCAGWKVTADPRGTLTIPGASHEIRIPCGTIQIDKYLSERNNRVGDIDPTLRTDYPSKEEGVRYGGVLYIEKEGFEPLLQEARIAEKYDLAILSCKGQSVAAARKLVDHVCQVGCGVPLYVVHDFDKAGFEISQRLTTVSEWAEENDRVVYEFQNDIEVYDLGLRLEDVEEYELQTERVQFKGGFASDSICTEEEKEFLRSNRRVELNAFTAPQFVEWLESKLSDHIKARLIPDENVLQDAYRRAMIVSRINRAAAIALGEAIQEAHEADIPDDLQERIRQAMDSTEGGWDAALYSLVESGDIGEGSW